MTLHEKIMVLYPSLTIEDFIPSTGTILLQNDSDNKGDYIRVWNHPTLSKPTEQELA
jgi:hypothetical protein